ncbi:MAG: hypothetical protein EZS28_019543, partial [Streblomastix strix]
MAIKKNNITTTQITLPYSDKATIGGKAVTPDPSKFKFGQLGINYLKGSETISIKNTNYEIVEFIPFEQTIKKVKEIIGDIDTAIETEIEEVINEKINDVREEIGDAVNEEKNDRIEADNIINNKITNLQLGKQNKLVKGQNITLTDLSDNTTRIDAEVDPLYIIVSVLPVSGNSNSIYLVSKTTSNENSKNGNNFEEYIWVDDDWEDLGAFEGGSVDLANYYTKSEINNKVSGINSYTVNTKSISGNPVLDGRDVKLDSYQKGVTLSEVIPADTVNQAIGKIEFRVGDYKTQTDNALLGKSSIYHTHDFSGLTEKPTTISGYGITDSLVSSTTFNTHTATTSGSVSHITSDERISWNNKFDKTGGTISGTVTADSFIKENGTNNDILLGDGEIISKDTFASSSHTHTIANVTDLQTTLNNKQNKLVEGKNIILTDDLTANTTTIKAVVDPLYIIVSVLPVSGNSNSIYLVPKTTSNENSKNDFEEYIWVEDDWEDLGVFDGGAVDLTNYYDKHEIGDIVTGINSYTVNSKIISGNPVLDGRDVKLDLYQKGTILSEVSSADTVNQAIGKIEFRVEDYKTQTDDALLDKSPTSHTHTFANLEDKPTTLSGYGITDSLVSSTTFNTHTADTTSHITSTERTTWNGKFDKSGGTINGNIVINGTLTFGESTSNKNNGGGGTKSVSDFQQKLIAGNGITLTPSETGTTINSVQNAGSASLATVGGELQIFVAVGNPNILTSSNGINWVILTSDINSLYSLFIGVGEEFSEIFKQFAQDITAGGTGDFDEIDAKLIEISDNVDRVETKTDTIINNVSGVNTSINTVISKEDTIINNVSGLSTDLSTVNTKLDNIYDGVSGLSSSLSTTKTDILSATTEIYTAIESIESNIIDGLIEIES